MAQQKLHCAKHDKVYEPDSTCDLCDLEKKAAAEGHDLKKNTTGRKKAAAEGPIEPGE